VCREGIAGMSDVLLMMYISVCCSAQSAHHAVCTTHNVTMQGGHKPGKPGILGDFSEHGILREFCATSGKLTALWVQPVSSNP